MWQRCRSCETTDTVGAKDWRSICAGPLGILRATFLAAQAPGDSQVTRGTSMIASDARAPADIEYVELRYGRPPSMSLYFDVRLRNLHPEARWFLLPRSLAEWRDIGGSG